MPEIMPQTVEKYALKICSIMNEISELEKLIRQRKGIVRYASSNTDKVIYKTILKLKNARIQLKSAMDVLLVRVDKEDTRSTPEGTELFR